MELQKFSDALLSGTSTEIAWQLWLSSILLFVVFYLFSSITSWYRLRHFDGPFLAKFSYLFMGYHATTGLQSETYAALNAKYGPYARIGPNDIATNDPDVIRRMGSVRSPYTRSSWYTAMRMNPYIDSMLSHRDIVAHDHLKSRTAAGYAGKENPSLELGIDAIIDEMKKLLRRKYVSLPGRPLTLLDFGRTAQYFTLDVITLISYGKQFGYLSQDMDVFEYIKTTEEVVPYMVLQAEVPIIQRILGHPWVLGFLGPSVKDKKGMGKLMAVAKEVVSKRFEPNAKDQRDMLGAFVRHGLTQRECESEVLFQILAGSDTTATAIRATMLYIITTPYVLQKLRDEIIAGIADRRISNPIRSEEGKQLPYLQAVIYEGLRIHPPFSGLAIKQVPLGGDTLPNGQFVPGGTRIAQSTWSVMRNTDIFGDDVELFRPERWLEADLAKRATMEKTTELVFGHGRWGCAGKTVAFMELNKTFVELLRDFDFQLINPTRPWHSQNFNLFMQSEMWVKVTQVEKNT